MKLGVLIRKVYVVVNVKILKHVVKRHSMIENTEECGNIKNLNRILKTTHLRRLRAFHYLSIISECPANHVSMGFVAH